MPLEALPALLLHYCSTFSLGSNASLSPFRPLIAELRRPSRQMGPSYMDARVYILYWNILKNKKLGIKFDILQYKFCHAACMVIFDGRFNTKKYRNNTVIFIQYFCSCTRTIRVARSVKPSVIIHTSNG